MTLKPDQRMVTFTLVALGAILIVASFGLIDSAAFRFLRQVRRAELGVFTVGVL